MGILSSLFSNVNKKETTKNAGRSAETSTALRGPETGMVLRAYVMKMPPFIGIVSSFTPDSLVLVRQTGQPEWQPCPKGESISVMPLDDTEPDMFVLKGKTLISTEDLLQIGEPEVSRFENRRSFHRIAISAPVLIYDGKDIRMTSVEDVGDLMDLSMDGAHVKSRYPHQMGEHLQVHIRLPDREAIVLPGTIIHTGLYGENEYHCGVRFHQLTSQDKRILSQITGNQKSAKGSHTQGRSYLLAQEVLSELVENTKEDREQNPELAKDMEGFLEQLEHAIQIRYPKTRIWENASPDDTPKTCLYISSDRMTAYVCILPPVSGNRQMDRQRLLAELRGRGTLNNLPPDALDRVEFLHISVVTRGTPAIDGVDGVVTELFPRRRRFLLQSHWRREPDFSIDAMPLAVRRGTPICRIQLPVQGMDGVDVTGKRLEARRAICPDIPTGENVELSPYRDAIIASTDGTLYVENGKFCIQPQQVLDRGLSAPSEIPTPDGILRVPGDLFIDGDVSGGVQIEAGGTVIISGQVRDARITSQNGWVRIQGGICGLEGQTFINAAGEVQAKVIQNAEIDTRGDVVADRVENSILHCGNTVRVMGGEGVISGSVIWVKQQIYCKRIDGSVRKCEFSLGCAPNTAEELTRIQQEIAQTQKIQDLLWKNTSQMKMSLSRLSDAQKAVLQQLLEQRSLYEEKLKQLKQTRKELQDRMRVDVEVHVRCEELEPILEIHIGNQTDRFTQREKRCDIHLENGWIAANSSKK